MSLMPNVDFFQFLRCVQQEESPHVQKNMLDDAELQTVEKCMHQSYSFSPQLLDHMKETHGFQLHPILDYCTTCECIFHQTPFAVAHYLQHVLTYQKMNVTNDPNHKHCAECAEHWANIQKARAHFCREVEFDRQLDKRSQHILKYLEEAVETLEEDEEAMEAPPPAKTVRFNE